MKFRLSRCQGLVFICAAVAILIVSAFPTFGAPHVRYTGSDPDHHVWNFGWPLATCIYDPANGPHLFIGPIAYAYALASVVGFIVLYVAVVAWNNRELILVSSAGSRVARTL